MQYVHYYGVDEPPAAHIVLQAGPVSMVFEPQQGFLRYLKLGDKEILRGIYAAVRDRNWGTVAPRLSHVQVKEANGGFEVSFDVSCVEGEIDFFWRGHISGKADGTVVFAMDGEARSSFLRNRIGFCVLHAPSACAGDPCVVEQVDGAVVKGHFPDAISPHQPFMNMRAISHEAVPGITARVAFEGDVFEMEDQRNWTDASYKTYCTPLAQPFPAQVNRGDRISQQVTVSVTGEVSRTEKMRTADVVALSAVEGAPVQIPGIGLGLSGQALTAREVARLRALHLAHVRVDVHLSRGDWRETLAQAVAQANALDVKIEAAVFVSDAAGAELKALGEALPEMRPRVARWLVFHKDEKATTAGWVRLAKSVLKGYDTGIPIGGGTNAYFTELNRFRPPVEDLETVCYSINPQVHAFDNASLVETLVAQGWTVASARRFAGAVPIALTPITLRPRFNPNATGADSENAPDTLPASVDVRQASLFGAAWTVGSLKYVCQAGVQSATYFETTGWRGVLDTEAGSPAPFPGMPGGAFPLYHVLLDVGGMAGGVVVPTRSSDALRADGLVVKKGRFVRFLLANMTAEVQMVRVSYPGLSGTVRTEVMDETNVEAAMREPEAFRIKKAPELGIGSVVVSGGAFVLELRPYAVACAKAVVEV